MHEIDYYPFPQGNPGHPSFTLLQSWWQDLKHDKGGNALLRRATSLSEVMLSPAYLSLLRSLRHNKFSIGSHNLPLAKVAAISGLAARIKEEVHDGLAKRMGTPKLGGSTAALSELRLRRILACDDTEELYTLLRRALALLGDQANLPDLAAIIWNWSPLDEKRPYDPRRQMAYDYYATAPTKH